MTYTWLMVQCLCTLVIVIKCCGESVESLMNCSKLHNYIIMWQTSYLQQHLNIRTRSGYGQDEGNSERNVESIRY